MLRPLHFAGSNLIVRSVKFVCEDALYVLGRISRYVRSTYIRVPLPGVGGLQDAKDTMACRSLFSME